MRSTWATSEWRGLVRGRIVANLLAFKPVLDIDTVQLAAENQDAVAFDDRGWQRLLKLAG